MAKENFRLDIVKSGALIKFEDESYGFVRCQNFEKIDEQTLKLNGFEVASVYIKYMNDLVFHQKDERMANYAKKGLANAIKKSRSELDLYQHEFSVSHWTISEIEREKTMPRYETLKEIANDLNMTFPELMSEASLEMYRVIDGE